MKTRHSSPLLLLSGLLLFASCQTLEQFSIDYMEPAEVSFPEELQRAGVVNNTPNSPNPDMPTLRAEHEQAPNIVSHKAERYDGKDVDGCGDEHILPRVAEPREPPERERSAEGVHRGEQDGRRRARGI